MQRGHRHALLVTFTLGLVASAAQPTERLTDQEVARAIDFGLAHEVKPHELRGSTGYTAAFLYTPFVRIGMAARAADSRGVTFTSADVPEAWREPVVYVAMRWFPYEPGESSASYVGDRKLAVTLVPRGKLPDSLDRVDPLWLTHDTSILLAFAASLPAKDVVAIAAYPMAPLAALEAEHEFVVFYRMMTETGRRGGRGRVARLTMADIAALR